MHYYTDKLKYKFFGKEKLQTLKIVITVFKKISLKKGWFTILPAFSVSYYIQSITWLST